MPNTPSNIIQDMVGYERRMTRIERGLQSSVQASSMPVYTSLHRDSSTQVYANNTKVLMVWDTAVNNGNGWNVSNPSRIPVDPWTIYHITFQIDLPAATYTYLGWEIKANSGGVYAGGFTRAYGDAYGGTTQFPNFPSIVATQGTDTYIEVFFSQTSAASRTATWQAVKILKAGGY